MPNVFAYANLTIAVVYLTMAALLVPRFGRKFVSLVAMAVCGTASVIHLRLFDVAVGAEGTAAKAVANPTAAVLYAVYALLLIVLAWVLHRMVPGAKSSQRARRQQGQAETGTEEGGAA